MTDFADRSPDVGSPLRPGAKTELAPLRPDRASKQHRFWPRLLLLLGAVAGLWLVHGPLLRGAADLLVVDEPADHAQYVCLSSWEFGPDGDRAYDVAATLFRQNPACHILLIGSGPSRLVESGSLASFETISRRELAARGLPQKAIESISRDGWDDWATARALRPWLLDRPAAVVVLLCGRMRSAHVRRVLSAVLDPSQAAGVRVQGLRDRHFDETNWWLSRRGYKAFGMAWLRRFCEWRAGGDHAPPRLQNADDYERSFRLTLSEAAP
jgi:hypothetical protein